MRGASPQDIGHEIMTRMQPKRSRPQPPFKHTGMGTRLNQKIIKDLMNIGL